MVEYRERKRTEGLLAQMALLSGNSWFSWRRNVERLTYCLRYLKCNGLLALWRHLRTEVFFLERPSSVCIFFRGLSADGSYTLRRKAWMRMISNARVIDVVITYFVSAGGASLYVRRHTSDKSVLTIVVRNTNKAGVICCQGWSGGHKKLEVYASGLDVLQSLPREKCRELFLNQLMTWESYVGERTMTPFALGKIIDAIERVKKSLNFKCVIPIHDYFSICPRAFFVDKHGLYCGYGEDVHRCNTCLEGRGVLIEKWRAAMWRLLRQGAPIRCFSDDSRRRMLKIYPDLKNVEVVQHDPIESFSTLRLEKDKGMVVGVVGSITHIKGREHVLSLLRYMDEHEEDAKLVVIGGLDGAPCTSNRLVVTGRYAHSDLPRILSQHHVNVAFFPSICPETFGFVVQELKLMGLPIACFDLGAQAEYVAQYEKGLVVKSMRTADVWRDLKRLYDVA